MALDDKTKVAIVYIVGLFIQVLDGTIVNVAIPTLAEEFGVESTDVDWALIGYYLALAAVIPIAGWIGDRFGTKRTFLFALVGFVFASALCGAAQTLDQLVGFRILQGAFSGLIAPVGAAMLYRAFPLEERARANTAVVGVVVVSPAIGPVLGGILIETLSWRWIFYVNIPIGALGVTLGWRWLREEIIGVTGGVDWLGLLLTAGGLGALLFGVSEGPSRGWGSSLVLATIAIGIIALATLVVVELRVDSPVLALRLYRDRLFRTMNMVSLPAYAAFFSLIFLLPVFLQEVADLGPAATGFVLLPQPLGVIISSQIAGRRFYARYGPKPLLIAGLLTAFVTSFALVGVSDTTAPLLISLAMFGRGLAMGFVFIPIQTASYATTTPNDLGRATSLFNTQRQVAVAVGVAMVGTLLAATTTTLDDLASSPVLRAEAVDGFRLAFGVSAAAFLIAAAFALRIVNSDADATRTARR